MEVQRGTRRSLRAIDDYQLVDAREDEMMESIGARVLAPVGRSLTDLARRLTPVGYVDNVKRKIVLAGSPPGYEVDRFLILKLLGAASIILWIGLAAAFLGDHRLLRSSS